MIRPRSIAAALGVAAVCIVAGASAASAATEPVRLAAPSDCADNSGCGRGLLRVYHVDVRSVLTKLLDADGGVEALDEGRAEVAVVFSANPFAGRRDLITLRDDRGMIGPENLVPIVRARTLRAYGRAAGAIRDRVARVSRMLGVTDLRVLEQFALDGRAPEPIAGEWVEAHGLGVRATPRRGPPIVFGYQAFSQNEISARIYAQALAGAGFKTAARPVGGLRRAQFAAYDHRRINASIGYATSTLRYLRRASTTTSPVTVQRRLSDALARRGLTPLTYAKAYNENTFMMRRSVAERLGVRTLSDLQRLWPAAAGPAP